MKSRNELIDKWKGTGILNNLELNEKGELAELFERGSILLVKWANEDPRPINNFESFAGVFLPGISRKYKKDFKTFDIEEFAKYLQINIGMLEELQEFAKNSSANIDCEDQFLNACIQ